MNRSARTAETVSDVYLALMLSAFLLWTGPDGYTKILEAKYRLTVYLYYYERLLRRCGAVCTAADQNGLLLQAAACRPPG